MSWSEWVGLGRRWGVRATLAGQSVETTVDSEAAWYYLERYLQGERAGGAWDAALDRLELDLGDLDEARVMLQKMSGELSPDLATLFLVTRLLEQPWNQTWQEAFFRELALLRRTVDLSRLPALANASSYLVLVAPGWHYRTNPSTGADLAVPRSALAQAGLEALLMETEDDTPVERNAALVAEEVARHARSGRKLILVSPSKAGAEVAQALGEMLTPEQSQAVKAWINISGLVRGTPLVDIWLESWRRWLLRPFCAVMRWRFDSALSMSNARARALYRRLAIPSRILVLNYIGAPLSGDVTARARRTYRSLSPYGPNDGLTLLVDEIVDGSITLVELGLDHYYEDAQMELKAVALARAVIGHLEGERTLPEPPPRPDR